MRQSRYQRFVLIVDGCHSGALFRNNRGIPDGLIALTSCSAEEVSGDTPLTQSLLRALNSCRADKNHNGCMTVDDGYDLIGQDKTPMAFVAYPQKWVWNLSEPILQIRSSLRVFLSYSRADSQIADRLVQSLERQGVLVWRDISSVPSGTDWLKSLVDALRQSRAILLRMTENPFKKDWGRRELEFADPEKPPLPIMPVILHEFEPLPWFSFQFGHFQRQQFSLTELDQSAAALATAIRKMIANTPSAGSDAMTSAPLE